MQGGAPHELGQRAGLDDQGVAFAVPLGKLGVAVSPDDHVDPGQVPGQLAILLEAHMGEHDHHVGPLGPDLGQVAGDGLGSAFEVQTLQLLVGHVVADVRGVQADHGHIDALDLLHHVGGGSVHDRAVGGLHDVGGHDGSAQGADHPREGCLAPSEVVVAQGHGVEPEGLHGLGHRAPAGQVGDHRPLGQVAGVQHQCALGVLGPGAIDGRLEAGEASDQRVSTDRPVQHRVHGPVQIVHMHQVDLDRLLGDGRRLRSGTVRNGRKVALSQEAEAVHEVSEHPFPGGIEEPPLFEV